MNHIVTDQGTATASLESIGRALAEAVSKQTEANLHLRNLIVDVRPSGIITVDQMAEAVGRDRNYIDSVWSVWGNTVKGRQTRVPAADGGSDSTFKRLADAAAAQRAATSTVSVLRAERDRTVTLVYASKILGPTAIASAVGVDRNHVLRIARKSGAAPAHRVNSRNQYSN